MVKRDRSWRLSFGIKEPTSVGGVHFALGLASRLRWAQEANAVKRFGGEGLGEAFCGERRGPFWVSFIGKSPSCRDALWLVAPKEAKVEEPF